MHKVVDDRLVDELASGWMDGWMLNRKQTQTHVVRHRAAAGLFFSETLKAVNIQQPFTRRQTARGDEGGGGYKSRVYGLSMDQ